MDILSLKYKVKLLKTTRTNFVSDTSTFSRIRLYPLYSIYGCKRELSSEKLKYVFPQKAPTKKFKNLKIRS